MKAVSYARTGNPDVLHLAERDRPQPRLGEVLIRVVSAGVNPTDWKSRRGGSEPRDLDSPQVPGMDGAGVIEAIGPGVDDFHTGQRVWVWLAADRRTEGTTQEYVAIAAELVAPLPDNASFDLGASLGIPFITAHRCLTASEDGPAELSPGALSGRTVLVAGGAGAVGNAAIQLAAWSGAFVITTVSSAYKGTLATAAGADHVINYTTSDVADAVRHIAPQGVDVVVEVAPAANASINASVLRENGTVATYARDKDGLLTLPVWPSMQVNARWQFVLVYTLSDAAKRHAVDAIVGAIRQGAIRIGDDAGLPIHHFALDEAAQAHTAVENGTVGKVLVDVDRISGVDGEGQPMPPNPG